MPVQRGSDPPVERRSPERLFSQIFGRYRVFVDAWPIVTTVLLLSGALGIEAHFFLLGVNASEVLTLEEFTIFGVLGLVIALLVAMIGVAYFGSLLLYRTSWGAARSKRLRGFSKAFNAFIRKHPFTIAAIFSVILALDIWFGLRVQAFAGIRIPLMTGLAIASLAGLALLYAMGKKPGQARIGIILAVCIVFVAPGAGVFLVLSAPPPSVTVTLPTGVSPCDSAARLLWKGQKALVLDCQDQIVLVEDPQNVVIRPASGR